MYAAYLDIIELPIQFASVDDEGYYFVWDGERYSVARMNAAEYAQVETAIKEKGIYSCDNRVAHVSGCGVNIYSLYIWYKCFQIFRYSLSIPGSAFY